MAIRDTIHNIFGVKEPHELPSAMMRMLLDDEKRNEITGYYKNEFPDLNHDYLRDYFQENQADRSNLMQDYTPDSVCRLVSALAVTSGRIADLCAGTGSLTIEAWKKSPDSEFICYEVSSASIPFLLFNLVIRNISAYVVQGDLLIEEAAKIYRIENGTVSVVDDYPRDPVDSVITNPPYSLKWSGSHDLRFGAYPAAPKGFADYAFILIGLSMLKPGGRMTAVMPHGPLFRGSKEEEIRKALIEDGRLESVIGLPKNLFENTDIPVCLMTFSEKNGGVFVVNADEEFKKAGKINIMTDDHIENVLSVCRLKRDVDKLAHVATMKEIRENDYNLNIPRYVDRFEQEILPPPTEILRGLIKTHKEIKKQQFELLEDMKTMKANDVETGKEFDEFLQVFEEWCNL